MVPDDLSPGGTALHGEGVSIHRGGCEVDLPGLGRRSEAEVMEQGPRRIRLRFANPGLNGAQLDRLAGSGASQCRAA